MSLGYIRDSIHFINQAEFSPPTFEEGVLAENQLKKKIVPRKKAAFDDDEDDGLGSNLDDDMLFPAGGPTARRVADEVKKSKKKLQRSRRANSQEDEVDDAELAEKARKRRERELEKARRVKSALYVREGDDEFDSEEDEEFFAREREIAARAKQAAESAGPANPIYDANKKRKSEALLDISSDMDEDEDGDNASLTQKMLSSQEVQGGSETDDTPVEVSDGEARKRRRMSVELGDADEEDVMADKIAVGQDDGEGDDGDVAVVARRPRLRGGFVMEDSDDE